MWDLYLNTRMKTRMAANSRMESTDVSAMVALGSKTTSGLKSSQVRRRLAGVRSTSNGLHSGRDRGLGRGVVRDLEERSFQMVAAFVRGMLGDARHERRVAALAARLFGLTEDWHGMPRSALMTLRLGALLHDIGRAHDDDRHPELGAVIIKRARLPLTPRQRRVAMFLARYHRGAVPAEGHDEILLSGEYQAALTLLGLLRAADSLDSRSAGGAEVEFELTEKGAMRKLTVSVNPRRDSAKARKALAKRKKFRLLEELLGCGVRVKLD